MLHPSPRNFPCSQKGSLLLANLPILATQRSSLCFGLGLIQDPDRSHQHRLMEDLSQLHGPLKAVIQGQGFQQQRRLRMSQLVTTVCLAIAWHLQLRSGLLFLCSQLHLSHLLLQAHSNFLLSWATQHRFRWHPQPASGQLPQCLVSVKSNAPSPGSLFR
jgi:hypothetical protein